MTYGLCADIHAHAWAAFSFMVDEDKSHIVNSRLKDTMDAFDLCCERTNKEGGKRVYIAGDLFHVRGSIKTSVLNYTIYRIRKSARDHDVQVVLMPGNHDLEDKEITWLGNATMLLDDGEDPEYQLVRFVSDPMFFEEDMVAMVPWQDTREGLVEAVEQVKKEIGGDHAQVDLLLHTGINGVLVGMPDHGWSPEELAAFGFKRVLSGHYHNYKTFIVPFEGRETQVISIGALTHQSWRDVGTDAGFLIVDDVVHHFESEAPMFVDFKSVDEDEYKGNFVRVRDVDLDEKEIRELKEALEEAGAKAVVIQAIAKDKIVTRQQSGASNSVTMEKSISNWVDNAQIESTPDAVKDAALQVLTEARTLDHE